MKPVSAKGATTAYYPFNGIPVGPTHASSTTALPVFACVPHTGIAYVLFWLSYNQLPSLSYRKYLYEIVALAGRSISKYHDGRSLV